MKDFVRISVLELMTIILFKNKKYIPLGITVEYVFLFRYKVDISSLYTCDLSFYFSNCLDKRYYGRLQKSILRPMKSNIYILFVELAELRLHR